MKKGFTLIEILLVIAIIGILASIVLARAGNARDSANEARAQASIRSAVSAATICLDASINLNIPAAGTPVCGTEDNWPTPMGSGWDYGDFGTCAFDGDVSDRSFMFCATNGVRVIQCTEMGCATS